MELARIRPRVEVKTDPIASAINILETRPRDLNVLRAESALPKKGVVGCFCKLYLCMFTYTGSLTLTAKKKKKKH